MPVKNPLPARNSDLPMGSPPLIPQRLIRRQFLLDTLQEKSILLPLAICILSLIYLILYAPILGGFFVAGLLSLAGGVFWAGGLLWRAGIRYQQGYARKLQELAHQFEVESAKRIDTQLKQSLVSLETGFQEIRYQDGLRILRGISHEYRELQRVMASEAEEDLLSSSNLEALVRETYIQGLKVLELALELVRATDAAQYNQLKSDIQRLEEKSVAATRDPGRDESMQLIQVKIDFHKERLTMMDKLHVRVDELLHQADICEASLSKTRIELAELKADASNERVLSVISSLQKTIERAKEVQAELKRQGY